MNPQVELHAAPRLVPRASMRWEKHRHEFAGFVAGARWRGLFLVKVADPVKAFGGWCVDFEYLLESDLKKVYPA